MPRRIYIKPPRDRHVAIMGPLSDLFSLLHYSLFFLRFLPFIFAFSRPWTTLACCGLQHHLPAMDDLILNTPDIFSGFVSSKGTKQSSTKKKKVQNNHRVTSCMPRTGRDSRHPVIWHFLLVRLNTQSGCS